MWQPLYVFGLPDFTIGSCRIYMIVEQDFNDLFLDLVVYPNGLSEVDDMDELEEALLSGHITQQQFDLAVHTCNRLKCALAGNAASFKEFTKLCYDMVT